MSSDLTRRGFSRGFSLIETMIAAALLGLVGAAVATVLSFAARESGLSRLRTIAAAQTRETLERVAHSVRLAQHHGIADADLCALLEGSGGPMDASAPATTLGACPDRTVSGIPVPGTQLAVQASITVIPAAGTVPRRYSIIVTVDGGELPAPISASTIIVRDST